jgi:hypothetical protein
LLTQNHHRRSGFNWRYRIQSPDMTFIIGVLTPDMKSILMLEID